MLACSLVQFIIQFIKMCFHEETFDESFNKLINENNENSVYLVDGIKIYIICL